MPAIRTLASLRTAATLLGAMLLVPLLSACPKGDVGASCNHGDVQAPESQVVTFPALSCNDLLCVFAQSDPTPKEDCKVNGMDNDAKCNADGGTRFQCINNNCKLSSTYVLQRSMCSRTCADDADCKDGGIGKKVLADDSTCSSEFKCARIQKLGEFCCQKLCVCGDDLSLDSLKDLDAACDALDPDPDNPDKKLCDPTEMMMPGATTGTTSTTG